MRMKCEGGGGGGGAETKEGAEKKLTTLEEKFESHYNESLVVDVQLTMDSKPEVFNVNKWTKLLRVRNCSNCHCLRGIWGGEFENNCKVLKHLMLNIGKVEDFLVFVEKRSWETFVRFSSIEIDAQWMFQNLTNVLNSLFTQYNCKLFKHFLRQNSEASKPHKCLRTNLALLFLQLHLSFSLFLNKATRKWKNVYEEMNFNFMCNFSPSPPPLQLLALTKLLTF